MLSTQVNVTNVSLKSTAPGTQYKGYFGGVFNNKFGRESIALYKKDSAGILHCETMPYSADLKNKIVGGTAYVELTYLGKVQRGKYEAHNFNVICSPLPPNNPKAKEFMDVLHFHCKSLNETPEQVPRSSGPQFTKAAPVPNDPFGALDESFSRPHVATTFAEDLPF